MKHTKKLFMILLVVFLIVGLGTLAAADVTQNDTSVTKNTDVTKINTQNKDTTSTSKISTTTNKDNKENIKDTKTNLNTTKEKTITKSNSTKTVKTASITIDVSDYITLKNTLNNTNYDDVTINLGDNITLTGNPALSNSITKLTINGNGKSIDGDGKFNFLTINRQTVIINNITITNCYQRTGGAIKNNNGNVTITNSTLNNNKGVWGGAIYTNGPLTLTNTNLTNNTVEIHGGAISGDTNSNITIKESSFTNNTAETGRGGAIYSQKILSITNTNLTNNKGINGGAIYGDPNSNITITESNLKNNTAIWGGAIFTNGIMTITGSNITNNNVTARINPNNQNIEGGNGGAIAGYEKSIITITQSNLNDNIAERFGGAIYNRGNMTINGSTLKNNKAIGYHGGAISGEVNSKLTITESSLTDNSAGIHGGALFAYESNITITLSNLTDNSAVRGGAAYTHGNLTLTQNNITENKVTVTGGAITGADTSIITITENNISNNTAEQFGGAIHTTGTMTITLNNITNNNASAGGAISGTNTSSITITQNNITNNNATQQGGAIFTNGTVTIKQSNITNNTAVNYGGAIYGHENSNMTITDSKITNNTATRNDARGGAIYTSGNLTITQSNISNNTATERGGAIYGHANNNIRITQTNITNNTAKYGGAIYTYRNLALEQSNLTNNNATENGGAILGDANSNITITNSKITNNTATEMGGAIYVLNNAQITTIESDIANNRARDGGAIFGRHSASITITQSNIRNNTAINNGGAVYASEYGNLTITNSNFVDNYLNNNFGYVVEFKNSNNIKITDNTFTNNTYNERDMLFSNAKSDATINIHDNQYYNNSLDTTITQLNNDTIRTINDTTLSYPVNVTVRSIYNHTVNKGTIYVKSDKIDDSYDVHNNPTTIQISNADLDKAKNDVNYNYTDIDNNYKNAEASFTIFKYAPTYLNITLNPNTTVNVGDTVSVTVTLTDEQGNKLEGHEIGILINGERHTIPDNITKANGQITFDYIVPSYKINNIEGEIIFTAEHDETHTSYYDSSETAKAFLNIKEIPTHIHINHNKTDAIEGNTLNVTIILCEDEISHAAIAGEKIYYNITSIDGSTLIDSGDFISTADGYNVTISELPEDGYIVNAWFEGSTKYIESSEDEEIIPGYIGTGLFVIVENPSEPTFINQTKNITLRLTESDGTPFPDNTVVFVKINNQTEIPVTVIGGEGKINYTSPISGRMNITARFPKSTTHSGTSGEEHYHVEVLPTEITLEHNSMKVENTTITAYINDTVHNKPVNGGLVTISENGEVLQTVPVEDGKVVFTLEGLTAGAHNLKVEYTGVDGIYDTDEESTGMLNIEKTHTTTTIEPVTVLVSDSEVTIRVKVTDENNKNLTTGTVNISVETLPPFNNVAIDNGIATITIDNLPAGIYNINATFNEDDTYHSSRSSNIATLTVNKLPTNTTIQVVNTTLGNVTINVTVTNSSGEKVGQGSIAVLDENEEEIFGLGEVLLNNGEAIVTLPIQQAGPYNIKVRYNENDIYLESYAKNQTDGNLIPITVTKIPTTTKVEVLDNTLDNVTIKVTVTNMTDNKVTTGSIIVYYNNHVIASEDLVNGEQTLKLPITQLGENIIKVEYVENAVYLKSYAFNETTGKDEITINVEKIPTKLALEVLDTALGNVTVKVTVTNMTDNKVTTGSITVLNRDNIAIEGLTDVVLTDGEAIITLPSEYVGENVMVHINYTENDIYKGCNYENESLDITNPNRNLTNITVTSIPTSTLVEILDTTLGNVTVRVSVTNLTGELVPEGEVIIKNSTGSIIGNGNINEGPITFTVPANQIGTTFIRAEYVGTTNYLPSNARNESLPEGDPEEHDIKIDVTRIPTITTVEILDTGLGNVTIKVTTTNTTGDNVTTGSITILDPQGNPITELTNIELTNGSTEIKIPSQQVGQTIQIIAHYNQNNIYEASNATGNTVHNDNITEITVTRMATTTHAEQPANNSIGHIAIPVTVKDLNENLVTEGILIITDENGKELGRADVNSTGKTYVPVQVDTIDPVNLIIKFNGTEKYLPSEDTLTINPEKQNTKINATDNKNGTINVNITTDTDEPVRNMPVNVTLPDGTFITTGKTDENGTVNITIPLPPGTYDINISHPGNDTLNPANTTTTITIPKIPTQITATANNGTNTKTSLDITLTDENNNPINNTMVFVTDKDGKPIANGTTDENGKVNIPVKLPTGTTDLTITYPGNNTYLTSNTTTPITTLPHNNTINAKDNKNGTLNINLTDDDKKAVPNMPITVTLPNGTQIASGTTNENGTTNITIPLPPGTYNLNITTPGDENNNPANTTTTITIPKIPTQITATANNGTNTKTSLDITLTDNNGKPIQRTQVFITDKNGKPIANGTTDENGKVNIPVKLPTGTTVLTITYPGNNTYLTSNTTTPITTLPHNNTINAKDNKNGTLNINLTDDDKKAVPNMPVKITLPNGTQIANGTTDKNGKLDITLPLEPGDYIVNITTPGDKDNNPANRTLPVTIPPKDTKMDVKVNNGTQPTVDVKLTDANGKPIGGAPITIKDKNGKTIGNGTTRPDGTVNIPIDIPVGRQDITASYPGNRTYKPTNKTAPARKDKQTPVMDVVASPNGTVKVKITDVKGKAIPGLPVNITDEKGNVIGRGTTDKDGIVTAQTSLTPGPHNITAATPGNENYTPANKTVPVVIPPKDTKLNTTVLDPTRGNTTVKVNLTDKDNKAIPNAPITVTLPNGTKIPATTKADGTVEIPLNLPVGNNQIKVDYPGNQTYKPASQTIPVNVQKTPTTTTLNILNNTAGNVRVTGTVKDKYGRNVPEGTVTIKSGNNTVGTGTVTNGVYTITTNIANKGTYTLQAQYAGTNNYLPSNSPPRSVTVVSQTPTLTANVEGNKVGNTNVTATLKDPQGKPISNAPITVTLPNGTKVSGTTNSNGVAKIPVDLRAGNNNIIINYPGNGTYNPASTATTATVTKNMPVIKLDPVKGIIGEKITLTAYLNDANGTPISGGNLAFKLNGKTLRADGRFDSDAPAMKFSVKNGKVSYTINADLYLRNAKNLTAAYSGNYKYEEIGSPTVEAQIQKRYANVTVTVTPTLNKQYDTIKFTATARDTTRNHKNTTLINQNTSIMFKVNGNTLKDKNGKIIYVPVDANKQATYYYTIPAGTGGITSTKQMRDYKVEAVFVGNNYYPGARNSSKFNVERSPITININEAKVTTSNILSVKATIKDYKGNNVLGTNKYTIKVNGKSYTDKNGKPVYWSAKNGVINLSGIQIDPKTTIKRVMVVTGDRQAYLEGRNETTTIIKA